MAVTSCLAYLIIWQSCGVLDNSDLDILHWIQISYVQIETGVSNLTNHLAMGRATELTQDTMSL
jgi:hypothetical protein